MSAFRWVVFAVGVAMLFLTFFLYPGEETAIHNRLSNWWVTVTTTGEAAVAGHVSFVKHACASFLRALDWVFGKRRLSLRMLWVSFTWSIASMVLCALYAAAIMLLDAWRGGFLTTFLSKLRPDTGSYVAKAAITGWSLFVAGLLPGAFLHVAARGGVRRWATFFALLLNAVPSYYFLRWFWGVLDIFVTIRFYKGLAVVSVLFLIALVLDVVFLSVYRWALRECAEEPTWRRGVYTILALWGQPFQGDFFRDSASRRAVDT